MNIKIKTTVAFSGVPKHTTGEAERDGKLWKVTWNLKYGSSLYSKTKQLVDWFDQEEFDRFLVTI